MGGTSLIDDRAWVLDFAAVDGEKAATRHLATDGVRNLIWAILFYLLVALRLILDIDRMYSNLPTISIIWILLRKRCSTVATALKHLNTIIIVVYLQILVGSYITIVIAVVGARLQCRTLIVEAELVLILSPLQIVKTTLLLARFLSRITIIIQAVEKVFGQAIYIILIVMIYTISCNLERVRLRLVLSMIVLRL